MRYFGRLALIVVGLLAGGVQAEARDAVARLDSSAVVSARVDRGDKIDPKDLIEVRPGVFSTRPGAQKAREAKKCDLDSAQIATATAALNHARSTQETRSGLGADYVFRFWLKDGRQVIVVVGDDIQTADGGILTFLDSRLVVLDRSDFDSLYRVAAEAGCPE